MLYNLTYCYYFYHFNYKKQTLFEEGSEWDNMRKFNEFSWKIFFIQKMIRAGFVSVIRYNPDGYRIHPELQVDRKY
jgi:hypothetical protein